MTAAAATRRKRPKVVAVECRWCGATAKPDRESRSYFVHGHPSQCPHRLDRVEALNGVHVGDLWRNRHTGGIDRIEECRLGGAQTYTDREPVFVMVQVGRDRGDRGDRGDEPEAPVEAREGDQLALTFTVEVEEPLSLAALATVEPDDHAHWSVHPMWSLVEHWEPLTRPGEWPVPWYDHDDRGYPMRSALDAWRCPGYRLRDGEPDERGKAYFHSRFTVEGHGIINWNGDGWLVEVKAD